MDGAGSSSPASAIVRPAGELNQHFADSMNLSQQHPHPQHHLIQAQHQQQQHQVQGYFDLWADRPIATKKIRLVEFSAFIEYRRQLQMAPMALANPDAAHSPALTLASLASAASSENDHSVATMNGTPLVASGASYVGDPAALPQSQLNPISSQFNQEVKPEPFQLGSQMQQQQQQPLINNHQHHQQLNQQLNESADYMLTPAIAPMSLNYQQQPATSTGFTRHSYVKIDYRHSGYRQSNKLERIDISQIQDKFPEVIGSEGLYQRGPSDAFYLIKFWADMNNDFEYNIEDQNSFFGFSCSFETLEPFKDITCSTKACSYGLQVVEKVEKIHGALNSSNGRYSYEIDRSPMCKFMIQFIKKLRQLPRATQMNSVLENFSVLQVVSSESTSEILLCLAFVFEIASDEHRNGSQYHVYKLSKD